MKDAADEAKKMRQTITGENNFYSTLPELRGPDIIVGGPPRTASTWLRGVLGKHPNVTVAKNEINSLHSIECGDLVSTLTIYSNQNTWKNTKSPPQLYCDKSPSYASMSENNIMMIHALFPNTKIILCKRNESDRLWSAIHHRMRQVNFIGNWIEFCTSDPYFIKTQLIDGHIDSHIVRWTSIFSNNNIIIIEYNDICNSPISSVNFVLNRLDIASIDELPKSQQTGILRRTQEQEVKKTPHDRPLNFIDVVHSIVESIKHPTPTPH
ncbi:MAG: sulfotransferase [Thalassobaculum sp.]|uniref:sulfotransferase n=1 Tax=Thalassobaculum sp. TaxID=2022740 RepID=UPI0032EE14D7